MQDVSMGMPHNLKNGFAVDYKIICLLQEIKYFCSVIKTFFISLANASSINHVLKFAQTNFAK